ncbi:DUF724 domain-containing protein 6-like isoform X2 [Malus domestica]|uniref:DUF724 domain-containing protein 6-like isoform X2 n=1 Tax=Malus domestica TaxID=3750 RepID=UPI0010A9E287|nr:DUF724 domain-containing protein 3-like isoform X2 [Malus domestica]
MAGSEGREEEQQQLQLFGVGSEVEVRTDEEGFKGALFRATIVTSPTNSASKKRKRALVEYKNLVTEDGSKQLKEYVDSEHLRPTPPQLADRNFEEGDVVDADYRDGWWTGVVGKVVENNSKYSVVFDNPPDLIEFQKDRLRLHQDWVNGEWVRPNKQEVLAASDTPQELEHLLPAQKDSNNLEVATKLENLSAAEENPESTNSGKNLMEQPSYPRSVKDKKMLTRNGSATDSRPVKKLKDDKAAEPILSITARQLRKTPDNKEIPQELPQLSTGVRGTRRTRKPVVRHQFIKTESLLGKNNVTKQENDGEVNSQWIHPVASKGRRTKSQTGSRLIPEAGYVCALPSQKREKEKDKEASASVSLAGQNVQNEGNIKETEVPQTIWSTTKGKEVTLAEKPAQLPDQELQVKDQKKSANDPAKPAQLPDQELQVKDQKKSANDPANEKSMVMSAELGSDSILANLLRSLVTFPDMEFKQQQAGGSSHKRKRGRPRKLAVVRSRASDGVKGQNMSGNVADKNDKNDQTPEEAALHVLRGMDSTAAKDASKRKTADFPGRCKIKEAAPIASDNPDDDDKPLSMWFGGMQLSAYVGESRPSPDANVNQHNDRQEPVEVASESPAVDAISGSGPYEEQGLPFVKSSPVWKTIETLEVFRLFPQNPHFRPLVECKEEYREGSAIGNMITFSSLTDKISRLQFDDHQSVFDSILESLVDLENYGFNVTILRRRVNDLLSVKDKQGRFQVESRDAEQKIMEHSREKNKLVEEADYIAKKIIELQDKHASIKSEVEAKEHVIARLRMSFDAMNEGIQSARSDFEKLALAPMN